MFYCQQKVGGANITFRLSYAVERNLRRAKNQSCYIVFDSIRMKKIPDVAVKREIKAKAPHISGIKKIIFVNKRRKCIDIYEK